jgi:hypothetical protein
MGKMFDEKINIFTYLSYASSQVETHQCQTILAMCFSLTEDKLLLPGMALMVCRRHSGHPKGVCPVLLPCPPPPPFSHNLHSSGKTLNI